MKRNILLLNSCPLGESEVSFWNTLIETHSDRYFFKFISSEASDQIAADEFILINYGWTIFENVWETAGEDTREVISRIAEKDHIWDIYESGRSEKLAGSWFIFWEVVVRLFNPAKAIVWNGHHVPEAALAEVCRLESIELLFAERGPLKGTFAIDESGVNFQSTFVNEYAKFNVRESENEIRKFAELYFNTGISNWKQPARLSDRGEFTTRLNIPANKTVLFLPSQVDQDSNAKLFSPNFANTADAISAVVHHCNEHADSVYLLVKKHPMQLRDPELDKLVFKSGQYVEDIHIFDCIKYCDGVVSINSSTAVEAALIGKPVLLLGQSILQFWSNAMVLNSRDELGITIANFLHLLSSSHLLTDTNYFSKLLFDYLYSADEGYRSLGFKGPSLGEESQMAEHNNNIYLFENKIENIGYIIPRNYEQAFESNRITLQLETNFNDLLKKFELANAETNRLRHRLEIQQQELTKLSSNVFVKVLRKLKLI